MLTWIKIICMGQIRLNGHEFEQAPGDGKGQGSLACCSPQCRKQSKMTEWLNNSNKSDSAGRQNGSATTSLKSLVKKLKNYFSLWLRNSTSKGPYRRSDPKYRQSFKPTLECHFLKVLILGGVLGLHCCTRAFPSCSAQASHWVASIAVARECMDFTSCGPEARGIFLDQGSNPRALHGQVDS